MGIQESMAGFPKNEGKHAFQTKRNRICRGQKESKKRVCLIPCWKLYLEGTVYVGLGRERRLEGWPEAKS